MMTRLNQVRRLNGWWLLLMGMAMSFAGCESDSVRSPVTIDPGNITIRRNQQQVFVATGGYDYTWSIENQALGTLTRTPEPHRVTYTAIATPEEGSATQVLRVTSWIDGAPGYDSATNRQTTASTGSYQATAEAYIVHLAD